MLNKDQLISKIKKVNAPPCRAHLADLLDCVRPLCLPDYQNYPNSHTVPRTETQDCEISTLTSRVESLCSQNKADFEAIQTEMKALKSSLSNFENFTSSLDHTRGVAPTTSAIPIDPDHVVTVEHDIPPVSSYVPNFLSGDECNELSNFLNTLTSFKKERGRSTIKFGEQYSYNGSREESIVEYPSVIKKVLDNINEKFGQDNVPLLNSCLVTKYSGPNSFIPEHSDNERAIHADSSIFTVSVGCDATVRFRDVHNGNTEQQVVETGSLYVMTRASQDLFRHSIARNEALSESDTRFSLTFRCLHWRNNNSTVIIGDSNTTGLKFSKFGSNAPANHGGTFGNAMPGKCVTAFTVDQLDPLKCIGHNNIVIHCGLNNIRGEDVTTEEEIRKVYVDLKTKISDIVCVNKRARIYVSTLLPTKSSGINKKVKVFNRLITDDLSKSFKDIRIINHYSRLSNVGRIPTPGLSRDTLHLNEAGLRVLSIAIKYSIFIDKRDLRERVAGARSGSGGTAERQRGPGDYAGVTDPGRHRGGGRTNRGRRGRNR